MRERVELRGAVKQHTVAFCMQWRGKAQSGLHQRNARVGQPAGHAQCIAQYRDHGKVLRCSQRAVFVQLQVRHARLGADLQVDVVGQ